jgi:hypothetical protein
METSPLPVKGCKIQACARRSGPLGREGSLSCHTCCDTAGPQFSRTHPKDRPNQSPLTTHMGTWKIYFNPVTHGVILMEMNKGTHSYCYLISDMLRLFEGLFSPL